MWLGVSQTLFECVFVSNFTCSFFIMSPSNRFGQFRWPVIRQRGGGQWSGWEDLSSSLNCCPPKMQACGVQAGGPGAHPGGYLLTWEWESLLEQWMVMEKMGGGPPRADGHSGEPPIHPPKLGPSPQRRVHNRRGWVEVERVGQDGELTEVAVPFPDPSHADATEARARGMERAKWVKRVCNSEGDWRRWGLQVEEWEHPKQKRVGSPSGGVLLRYVIFSSAHCPGQTTDLFVSCGRHTSAWNSGCWGWQ